jgi:hypothetical protein
MASLYEPTKRALIVVQWWGMMLNAHWYIPCLLIRTKYEKLSG